MGTSNSSTCLCDFLFDYNFTQHIFEPTHEKGNVLDLVLVFLSQIYLFIPYLHSVFQITSPLLPVL